MKMDFDEIQAITGSDVQLMLDSVQQIPGWGRHSTVDDLKNCRIRPVGRFYNAQDWDLTSHDE